METLPKAEAQSPGLTSTGELILQQHQVQGAGAARGAVPLHDADVGAATVILRARVLS